MFTLPPSFIGLDQMFKDIERFDRSPSYPPHTILLKKGKSSDQPDNYRIEVAVAGFTREEITVQEHDTHLIVLGNVDPESRYEDGYVLVHSGISKRGFQLKFKKTTNTSIKQTSLVDGILTIELETTAPKESMKVYRF